MPDIAASSIYSSLKFIATDASGNLSEVESIDAVQASKTAGNITFKAKEAGVAGNSITVAVTEVLNASADTVTVSGTDIVVALRKIDAVQARKSIGGVTFKAKVAGTAGESITVEVTESSASGADAVTVTGSDIVVAFDGLASDSSTLDLKSLIDAEPAAAALISVNGASASAAETFSQTNLAEGVNAVVAASSSTLDIKNLIEAEPAAAALVAISGTSGSTPAETFAQTSLDDVLGVDAVAGELDPSENYLLIKQADLYDLSDDEQTDGRKVVWGLIDKAATAFAGMSAQPDNLKIVKSVPTSTDSGTSLKQVYTITAKYALTGLDLKAES